MDEVVAVVAPKIDSDIALGTPEDKSRSVGLNDISAVLTNEYQAGALTSLFWDAHGDAVNDASFSPFLKMIGGQDHAQHTSDSITNDPDQNHESELGRQTTTFNYNVQELNENEGYAAATNTHIDRSNYMSVINRTETDPEARRRKEEEERFEALMLAIETTQQAVERLHREIAELERERDKLKEKLETADVALDLLDDRDLNDDTLVGASKRMKLSRSMRALGLDPDHFVDANGKFDIEAARRAVEEQRSADAQRMREVQRELERKYHELDQKVREAEQKAVASVRGDPSATADIRRIASTEAGARNVLEATFKPSNNFSEEERAKILSNVAPSGQKMTREEIALASSDLSDEELLKVLEQGGSAPSNTSVVAASNSLPSQSDVIDTRTPVIEADAGVAASGPNFSTLRDRNTGSFAAEIGMDGVETSSSVASIKPAFALAVVPQTNSPASEMPARVIEQDLRNARNSVSVGGLNA